MNPALNNLYDLLESIHIRALEGVLFLDEEVPLRQMASATLRGIAGHALRARHPEMVDRWFKPGAGNDMPSACIFQNLQRDTASTSQFPFRILTWDPDGDLLEALYTSMESISGVPFGETNATIAHIEWDAPLTIQFADSLPDNPRQRVILHTPFRYQYRNQWITEQHLNLNIIARATVTRLNKISQFYGSNMYLHARPFLDDADQAVITQRDLITRTWRRSSTQHRNIDISGITGSINVDNMSPLLTNLLFTCAAFHIGKHTVEGCGHILMSDC
ncbi:MAG: CRISPR system precrRNA processing endoribonuclease RAMP protein Cas6 [Spartobacteria bacterium]|nr:CRISPR system precrRNA processing endoribonuclease RAMP protein Cas6 [Spartobacteria bacterium]